MKSIFACNMHLKNIDPHDSTFIATDWELHQLASRENLRSHGQPRAGCWLLQTSLAAGCVLLWSLWPSCFTSYDVCAGRCVLPSLHCLFFWTSLTVFASQNAGFCFMMAAQKVLHVWGIPFQSDFSRMPFGVLLGWDWLVSRQEYVGKHCRRVDVLHMPVGVL